MRGLVSKCCQDVLNLLLTRRGSPMGGRWRQLISQLVQWGWAFQWWQWQQWGWRCQGGNRQWGWGCQSGEGMLPTGSSTNQSLPPYWGHYTLGSGTIHYTLTNFDRRDFSAIFQFCNNKVCECVSFLKISSALLFLLRCLPRRPFLLSVITQRTLRTIPHF